jgi:hypothetical protein
VSPFSNFKTLKFSGVFVVVVLCVARAKEGTEQTAAAGLLLYKPSNLFLARERAQ